MTLSYLTRFQYHQPFPESLNRFSDFPLYLYQKEIKRLKKCSSIAKIFFAASSVLAVMSTYFPHLSSPLPGRRIYFLDLSPYLFTLSIAGYALGCVVKSYSFNISNFFFKKTLEKEDLPSILNAYFQDKFPKELEETKKERTYCVVRFDRDAHLKKVPSPSMYFYSMIQKQDFLAVAFAPEEIDRKLQQKEWRGISEFRAPDKTTSPTCT